MERHFQRVSPKTLECYENAYKFFAPVLNTLELELANPFNPGYALQDALQKRVETELRSHDPLSPTSINIYGRVMNSFLHWRYGKEYRLRPVKEPTGERRQIFTDQEVERLIKYKPKSFNQLRAWTIAICMLDTGVRIDEALSIETTDVDFNSDLIFIATGKGEKSGHVPISEMFRPILYRYMSRTQPNESAFVFGTTKGTKMSQRNALRDIRVVERAAGVRGLSWHSTDTRWQRAICGGAVISTSCNEYCAMQISAPLKSTCISPATSRRKGTKPSVHWPQSNHADSRSRCAVRPGCAQRPSSNHDGSHFPDAPSQDRIAFRLTFLSAIRPGRWPGCLRWPSHRLRRG